MKKTPHGLDLIRYFGKNFLAVAGIVLIWRGIWHILDQVDVRVFGGNTMITAAGGIIIGFLCLYLPDKDLKEIEKL